MKPHVEGPDFERMAEDRKVFLEAKADREESQKTIHILTEQREDYRKQVVFLEGQVKGLRSSTGSADMGAEPGPEWSAEYSQGWDDCLEAIHKVLGERFPRRVSLLVSASISPNIKTIDDAAVDIVARAINRADTHGTEKEEETLWNEIKAIRRAQARAAIDAIREMTE